MNEKYIFHQDVFFVGYIGLEDYCGNSNCSYAGLKLQEEYITHLTLSGITIQKVFCFVEVPSFPHSKHLFIQNKKFKKNGIQYECVPYINIWGLRELTSVFNLKKRIKRITSEGFFFTYNYNFEIAKSLRIISPDRICCIMADLPIFEKKSSLLTNWIHNQQMKLTFNYIAELKIVIILNENEKLYFPNLQTQFLLLEGAVDKQIIQEAISKTHNKNFSIRTPFVIVYTGAITKYCGIDRLIEACRQLSQHYVIELHVYGREAKRKDFFSQQSFVEFHGFVTHEEASMAQFNANLVVNPRIIHNMISQTTFPSKLFEYILSGTPVLITKIDGIPNEYFNYVFSCDDDYNSIAYAIENIMHMDPEMLRTNILSSQEFLYKEKNWDHQIARLVEFLSDIVKS